MNVVTGTYSMPLRGQLYSGPPLVLRDCHAIFARWEADTELVTQCLPPGFTPREDPVQCTAMGGTFPESSLGPYNELLIKVRAMFQGEPCQYLLFAYVDSDVALAHGREVLGFGKKLAVMVMAATDSGASTFTVERPRGHGVLTISLNPDWAMTEPELDPSPTLTIRLIPSSVGNDRPDICELLELAGGATVRSRQDGAPDMVAGPCSVTVDSKSEVDPLYLVAPVRMLAGFEMRYDAVIPTARRVIDYLAEGSNSNRTADDVGRRLVTVESAPRITDLSTYGSDHV
jgi:acetoacetate decarboxylase